MKHGQKRKRITCWLLCISMIMTLISPVWAAGASAEQLSLNNDSVELQQVSGDWSSVANTAWYYNSSASEFLLGTANELAGLAKLVNEGNNFKGKTIKLANNINLSGKNWTPIGTAVGSSPLPFLGTFDGQGYSITGLNSTLVKTADFARVGLFGYGGKDTEICNLKLTIEGLIAKGTGAAAGLIAEIATVGTTIPQAGNIHDCYVTVAGDITVETTQSHSGAGAFAGIVWNGKIVDCFADINQDKTIFVTNKNGGTNNNAGGYVGYAKGCTIERSRSLVDGKISIESISGVLGGIDAAGGFIGYADSDCTITDSYTITGSSARVSVSAPSNPSALTVGVGGFLGVAGRNNSITTSYIVGRGASNFAIKSAGGGKMGLIAGRGQNSTFTNCYAYGAQSGMFLFGDLGTGTSPGTDRIESETLMKQQDTYKNFDFTNVWIMDEVGTGYPKIGTEADMTDEEIVAYAKKRLEFAEFKGSNTSADAVTTNLSLPSTGFKGAAFRWESSAADIITNDGKVVRPELSDATVSMTVTIQKGNAKDTKTFTLKVTALGTVTEWIELADTTWYQAEQQTFTVMSARHLAGLAKLVNEGNNFQGKTVKLGDSIELAGKNWTPIGRPGTAARPFLGAFDGQGYSITGLDSTVKKTNDFAGAGLFGYGGKDTEICNLKLTIKGLIAKGTGAAAGLIAEIATVGTAIPQAGNIHDCYVTVAGDIEVGTTQSHSGVGAFAGIVWNGKIVDCFADINQDKTISVTNKDGGTNNNAGGYVGYAKECTIQRSRALVDGTIKINSISAPPSVGGSIDAAGGFIGYADSDCTIIDSYAITGSKGLVSVSAPSNPSTLTVGAGGFLGVAGRNNKITTSYFVGKGASNFAIKSAGGGKMGLIAGRGQNSTFTNCYAYGAQSGMLLFGDLGTGTSSGTDRLDSETQMKQQDTYKNFDFTNVWIMDEAGTGYPKIGTEADMTDEEIVAYAKKRLEFAEFKGSNTSADAVTTDLSLPSTGFKGAAFRWESSAADIITNDGKVVRPERIDATVRLTVTIQKGNAEDTKTFTLNVKVLDTITEWIELADTTWYQAEQQTFTVMSARHLAGLAKLVNEGNNFQGKTVKLGDSIELTGKNWTPIGRPGTAARPFLGVFDGQGYSITGLNSKVEKTNDFAGAGLFGYGGKDTEICNLKLTIKGLIAKGTGAAAGLIAEIATVGTAIPQAGNIHDCYVTVAGDIEVGTTQSHSGVGAFAGIVWNGKIVDCFADINQDKTISVTNKDGGTNNNAGGYVGYAKECTIQRSRALVDGEIKIDSISAPPSVGGSIDAAGGFIGYADSDCTIIDSYAITGNKGLVSVSAPSNTSALTVGVGGFIGVAGRNNKITTSYLVGRGASNFAINAGGGGSGKMGLIAGRGQNSTFTNCYAYGAQSGMFLFGDLGTGTSPGTDRIESETKMKQQDTYQNFDFTNVWIMDEAGTGYPKIGTETDMTDKEIVAHIKANLNFETIKGNNSSQDSVTDTLLLMTESFKGAVIQWSSSAPELVDVDGSVTPSNREDRSVTLTATIQKGDETDQVQIVVTVIKGMNWAEFWSNYWKTHDKVTWSVVGDSITASMLYFSKGYKQYYDWMEYRLNSEMGKNVEVVNSAISGYKMADFDANLANWSVQYNPDIVTLYFGMNDRSTDLTAVKNSLDSILNKLIPNEANVAAGAPEDRVIVLVACNPTYNEDGIMRQIHAYGQKRALELTAQEYHVQYLDWYSYLNQEMKYGADGNLSNRREYQADSLHLNPHGYYAAAQYLMKHMGMYSAESQVANIRHDQLFSQKNAPAQTLDYQKAKLKTNGGAFTNALTKSRGYVNISTGTNTTGTMLVLGGAATSGNHTSAPEYRSYPWLIEGYMRTIQGRSQKHSVVVADDGYDAAYFADNLDALKSKYKNTSFILYMPEVNELYSDNYSHSPTKVDAYGTALTSFADKCRTLGIELTLVTPFPMADTEKDKHLAEYIAKLEEVAESKGLSISNLYGVFKSAMKASPQIGRNWYTADGYPDYIAQVEAAKVFLGGTVGLSDNAYIFPYTYRNSTTDSGEQKDNFRLKPVLDGQLVKIDMRELLADPMYNTMSAAQGDFILQKTGEGGTTSIAYTYDAQAKLLSYDASLVGEQDIVQMKVFHGATTYLRPYGMADVMQEVDAEIKGTVELTVGNADRITAVLTQTVIDSAKAAYEYEPDASGGDIIAEITVDGLDSKKASYIFQKAPAGEYTLLIRKPGALYYQKNYLEVTAESVELQPVKLYVGDLNMDGVINNTDKGLVVHADNFLKRPGTVEQEPVLPAADLNDDGIINNTDKGLIVHADNFLKRALVE